jgi:hypothetical protein
MTGKTIRIYLVDGVPTGILTAEIINWTGRVVVSPRSQLDQLAARPEARRTGVYLLLGADPENTAREVVYIGEGDNVFDRLVKHNRDEHKDFWSRTALITSKDENLTKSHVRYLESRLIALTKQANRARLTNDTSPEPAPLPEPDVADMEFFLDQVQMVLPVLGFTFTQQVPAVQPTNEGAGTRPASPLFVMSPVGTSARAREIDGEFVVLEGSTARKQGVDSWTTYRTLRDQLMTEGKLSEVGGNGMLVFTEDVAFSSLSAAAAVVYGGNQNGRIAWKTEGGQTYQEWQDQKLAGAALPTGKSSVLDRN